MSLTLFLFSVLSLNSLSLSCLIIFSFSSLCFLISLKRRLLLYRHWLLRLLMLEALFTRIYLNMRLLLPASSSMSFSCISIWVGKKVRIVLAWTCPCGFTWVCGEITAFSKLTWSSPDATTRGSAICFLADGSSFDFWGLPVWGASQTWWGRARLLIFLP